ncbi:MAG TPA: ABC transporter permease subunit [Ktedonobacterales bacterium]|nr:ABC transporter permease subunit [Ktedonobacterales bacterium]
MLFRNIFLKTLRDFRIAILGWGVGLGLLMYAVIAAINSVVGAAGAGCASLLSLATSFEWIAEPIALCTPGGYATWKYGFTLLIMALWPLLVGARMLRGEEQRGSMDVLLTQPRGRVRVALEKLAAMWVALLLMGLIIGLLAFGGGKSVSADFGLGDALLFGLNLALISGVFGSIALLLSQFTRERGTAAGITAGLLLLFIILDTLHRVTSGTEWISRLSPVYYYNLSKPLIPAYGTNPGAILVLLALSVILSGAALWLFARRDVGATVSLPRWLRLPEREVSLERALPVNAWSLRSIYTRSLAKLAVPTFWWTVGIAGFAAYMVIIDEQVAQKLQSLINSSTLLQQEIGKVGGGGVNENATLLSFFFIFLPVILMAFAVTQASRWAADEEDGLHELVLSTPQPRLTVILARFGALTTATVIIGVMTLALTALASASSGLTLDGGNLAAASLSIIPMGLLMAALGYLFSGWLRTAIDTGLLSFLLVIWFTITFIGPDLNWPDGVLHLSAFYYYGTPVLNGLSLGNILGVLVVAVVALALASVRFVRKDIGR